MLPWLLRTRILRRPVALLGAACTSVLFGVFVLNKVLVNSAASCVATCRMSSFASYERLQKNEASKKMRHPMIESFDVNFLGSNSPIEDRFVVGTSAKLGSSLFSLIDGHKGGRCSHYLQTHMLRYIVSTLHQAAEIPHKTDLEIVLDMNMSLNLMPRIESGSQHGEFYYNLPLDSATIEKCLRESFVRLDSDISEAALADIKLVLAGHSFTEDMKERVMTAIEGACAITAIVQHKDVYVANTGDCRVVIGQEMADGRWQAVPLSLDQSVHNEAEVARLKSSHPGEDNTVIMQDRVLGSLMPFRTFGDVDYKWKKEYLEGLVVQVWPHYLTPPYMIAEPVVTRHELQKGDKFMILASDGLWERISNEEAINVVVQSMKGALPKNKSWFSTFFKGGGDDDGCCVENAATQLIWHSLGGNDEAVTQLLNADPRWRRMVRDDITVIVVFFRQSV